MFSPLFPELMIFAEFLFFVFLYRQRASVLCTGATPSHSGTVKHWCIHTRDDIESPLLEVLRAHQTNVCQQWPEYSWS